MAEVIVLRWGHRLRDERLTTHIILTARSLGASGEILSDVEDKDIKRTTEKFIERWGSPFFLKMAIPWTKAIREWREKGGIVVHLTAYGENIATSDVLKRIKYTGKDVMVIVGSQKVPPDFYREEVSDFNVAIGNEPHSECSALAIFLDRYFEGQELSKKFEDAKVKIIPQKRGKHIVFIPDEKNSKVEL